MRSLIRIFALVASTLASPLLAQHEASLLTERPNDPAAVFLKASADGSADATSDLQKAVDRVQETTRRGIVFIPSGRYLMTSTVHVWSGIRIIGYGKTRPVLFLPANQPGFASMAHHRPILHFASERPEQPTDNPPGGNSSTFYSGLLNVDLELGPGNPAAVGVSFRVAQHGVMSFVRIDAADGFAAVEQAGGVMANLLLRGGHYGIDTRQTAASWPFLLMDSELSGQLHAAIRSSEAHPVLIRNLIRDTPVALQIETNHPSQVYLRDTTFRRMHLGINMPGSANPMGLVAENILCDSVDAFATLPSRQVAVPAALSVVDSLHFGSAISQDGAEESEDQTQRIRPVSHLPIAPHSDVPPLPPSTMWRNFRDFGAAGDGMTDDTAALRLAIASGRPIYLPQGRYRITQPILLRTHTILIGFDPTTTQLDLPDSTPAFANRRASPVALLTAPLHGHTVLSGIGISTGGINPAASALLWQAGPDSLVDDVRFLGGHGTMLPGGHYRANYNADHTGDSDPARAWDTQPPSLLVLHGGGTFRNIWTPSPYAAAGLSARDTTVPARVYLLSAEHHVRNELTLDHVSHWHFYGLQTEAEKTDGGNGTPLAITASSDLLFANSIFYRTSRTTNAAPTAVTLSTTHNSLFLNTDAHSGSAFPFDNTITSQGTTIHQHFFTLWPAN